MRTTSGIQFYCRPCKTDKSGYAPIEVSITINSKRTIFHLPRKERPAEFEKQLRKSNCDLVEYCDTIRITINNAQTELLKRGIAVTADRLKEYVRSGGIKTYTVTDMVNEYMDILKLKTGMGVETYKKYRIIYDRFLEYVGAETEANMIGTGVMSKFNAIIYNENVESTAGGKMTKMKSLLRWAFECGKIPTMPMSNIRITKGKVKKEFLTPAEVTRIKKAHEKKIVIKFKANGKKKEFNSRTEMADFFGVNVKTVSNFLSKKQCKLSEKITLIQP